MDISMLKDPLILIGVPIIRALLGWLENAFKDGKVSSIELKKLLETILRVGTISVCGYYGFSLAGIDVPVLSATFGGVIIDFILSAMKKNGDVKIAIAKLPKKKK